MEHTAHHGHCDASRIALQELAAEHCEWTECRIDIDLTEWAEEMGFHTTGNLKAELIRASIARRAMLELLAQATPESYESKQHARRSAKSLGRPLRS